MRFLPLLLPLYPPHSYSCPSHGDNGNARLHFFAMGSGGGFKHWRERRGVDSPTRAAAAMMLEAALRQRGGGPLISGPGMVVVAVCRVYEVRPRNSAAICGKEPARGTKKFSGNVGC
jgi:hypothetical protein